MSRPSVVASGLLGAIRAYQMVSRFTPRMCRFEPSCSVYAAGAIAAHGAGAGSWLAAKRLARCHPFHPGGFDPVPARSPAEHQHV